MDRLKIEPVYKQFKGWKKNITEIKEFIDLPVEMKTYIEFINKSLGVNVQYISNGPGTDQIIMAS